MYCILSVYIVGWKHYLKISPATSVGSLSSAAAYYLQYNNRAVFLTSVIDQNTCLPGWYWRHSVVTPEISDKTEPVLCHRPGVIIPYRAAGFGGRKTSQKLSSITLVQSQRHVLSCHGLVQLAWRTANAHIQLKQSLIPLSQNQCRSVP